MDFGATHNLYLDGGGEPGSAAGLGLVGGVAAVDGATAAWRCETDEDCQSDQICVSGKCRKDVETCDLECDWVCEKWVWEWVEKCEWVFGEKLCWMERERFCVRWQKVSCRCE